MTTKNKKTWKRWTSEEIELLKYHWQYSDMDTLLSKLPGRNYLKLMHKARELKITSKARRNRTNGNIAILKEKSKQSFYLWGFIMADGCFTRKYDLSIGQSIKEKDFFYELISTLGGNLDSIKTQTTTTIFAELTMLNFRIGQKDLIIEMMDKLKLPFNKTYNPPQNIEYFFIKEYFINFVIGLIDGDGSIWNTKSSKYKNSKPWPNIRIEMHYNWLPILEKISIKLHGFYNIESKTKVSNKGFAQLVFQKKDSAKLLYEASKETIHMKRKWDRLDQYFT